MDHADPGLILSSRYELVELAGEGGMATVWRGLVHGASGWSREVGIKRVLPDFCDNDEFVQMFVEEARVGASLHHPNIVQIHDFGLDDGVYYLVMEWVEGLDLSSWSISYEMGGAHSPWLLVAAIGIEVLKALGAAHTRTDRNKQPIPVFHRDVTPHNILVGDNGIVKLSDFGLARAMDRARMTRPETVKGKLTYLAPELSFGKDPSPQTDIFSVGIVLWEVLAGKKLFDGMNPLEIIKQIRDMETPDLNAIRPDLPQDLIDVVEIALEKDPLDRYETAHEMARALADILRTVPQPTDSEIVGESVMLAKKRLRGKRVTLSSSWDDPGAKSAGSGNVLPLTTKK